MQPLEFTSHPANSILRLAWSLSNQLQSHTAKQGPTEKQQTFSTHSFKPLNSLALNPLYVHDPNFMSQLWSSNGNQVMSILHVLLKMPGGTYSIEPSAEATTLVWKVPSNLSSALKYESFLSTESGQCVSWLGTCYKEECLVSRGSLDESQQNQRPHILMCSTTSGSLSTPS